MLFVGCRGHVAAVDTNRGSERWRTQLAKRSSLLVGGDVNVLDDGPWLFAGSGGWVFALDRATGAIAWANDLPGMGHNDVTLALVGNVLVLVPHHRGFDQLRAQRRKRVRRHEALDAACLPRGATDQTELLEPEHHLVNTRRRHPKVPLHVGLGRGAAIHGAVGVDEGKVLTLLLGERWRC